MIVERSIVTVEPIIRIPPPSVSAVLLAIVVRTNEAVLPSLRVTPAPVAVELPVIDESVTLTVDPAETLIPRPLPSARTFVSVAEPITAIASPVMPVTVRFLIVALVLQTQKPIDTSPPPSISIPPPPSMVSGWMIAWSSLPAVSEIVPATSNLIVSAAVAGDALAVRDARREVVVRGEDRLTERAVAVVDEGVRGGVDRR